MHCTFADLGSNKVSSSSSSSSIDVRSQFISSNTHCKLCIKPNQQASVKGRFQYTVDVYRHNFFLNINN